MLSNLGRQDKRNRRKRSRGNQQKTNNKMTDLRANVINNCPKYKLSEYPIKERLAEWRKNMTKLYAMYKRLTSNSITKVDSKPKDGKKIYHTNIKETNARVSISLSKEVDLRTNKITRNKKGQYTLIK